MNSTNAPDLYSIVGYVCQCNFCDYSFDCSTPGKYRMSVNSYYNRHYQHGHNKERRQNNKRPKGSVAEEVVERPSKRSNCSILDEFDRNNDITVAHYSVKFDGVHHEGDDDDYVTNDSFDADYNDVGAIDEPEFNEDDGSIFSLLSKKSISTGSTVCTSSSDEKTNHEEPNQDWETLQDDYQYNATYADKYGLQEFDIYTSHFEDNTQSKSSHYCKNQVYFYQKQRHKSENEEDNTGGYMGLTERALGKNRSLVKIAQKFESELIFRLNAVLLNSTRLGSIDVMDLVKLLCSKISDHEISRIPKSYTEVRQVIIDGTFSTMVNFPCPRVFEIDGHACVSLKESIQIMAGHHGDFQFAWDCEEGERNEEGLNGSAAAAHLVGDVTLALNNGNGLTVGNTNIGWVYLWSDSYLNSFVKQKDNSVWILTATISPSAKDLSKRKFTVVLAIGKSSSDHTKVIEQFYKEISELKKGFKCYSSRHNRLVNVAFSLLYHSADRPERHSLTNTLDEGTYGLVSNYSAVICQEKLPACQKCYRYLLERIINNKKGDRPSCDNCLCWTIKECESDEEAIYPVPSKYPGHTELEPRPDKSVVKPPKGREPGRAFIGNKRLSTAWLIQACSYAYEARRQRQWNMDEFHDWLRSCNVNKARRQIIALAADIDAANGKCRSLEEIQEILPQLWYLFDLFDRSLLPDMPMHLLAHGVSDDVIHLFEEILKHFGLHSKFAKFANTYISDMESWNLSWLKLKAYPKASWVGENTMAYMRIQSYLYGIFLVNHGPKGKDPVEVQAASDENRFGSNEPQDTEDVSALVNSMRRMSNGFQAMISRVMSRVNQDPDEALNHIKLFMSLYNHCDSLFEPSCGEKPSDKGKKKVRVVDQLNDNELHQILFELRVTPDAAGSMSTLDRVKTKILQERLRSMKLSDKGNKSDLQCRLFSAMLNRNLVNLTKRRKILDALTKDDTEKILTELQVTESLDKINLQSLKCALEERSLSTEGTREDLRIRLFCHITGHKFNPTETSAPPLPSETTEQINNQGNGKKKKKTWVKGGMLSLLANYKELFYWFGQCHNIWEGRDEAKIQDTKPVTKHMRKSQSYLESMLRKMHRLMGFDTLRLDYSDEVEADRDWYRGHFIFPNQNDVKSRFTAGKPLSCFTLDGRPKCVFVAVKSSKNGTHHCIPINYEPDCDAKTEAGVHFCHFQCETGIVEIEKKDAHISSYAIMLPYVRVDGATIRSFMKQWTLIYHDWDVLRTDLEDEYYKGCASVSNEDLQNLIDELI